MLNPATGPVNGALGLIGIEGPLWFSDPSWSKPAITLLLLWGVGNTMIIFLAALVDVPAAPVRVGVARRRGRRGSGCAG